MGGTGTKGSPRCSLFPATEPRGGCYQVASSGPAGLTLVEPTGGNDGGGFNRARSESGAATGERTEGGAEKVEGSGRRPKNRGGPIK